MTTQIHLWLEALGLYIPNFNKYFLLYTFASEISLTIVLTSKDELNNERPIFFMSVSLQGPELNYPTVVKHDYAVYKVINNFCPYLLKKPLCYLYPTPSNQITPCLTRVGWKNSELDEQVTRIWSRNQASSHNQGPWYLSTGNKINKYKGGRRRYFRMGARNWYVQRWVNLPYY